MDEEQLYRGLGQRLLRYRREAGRTQEQVANDVGLKRTSITNIEQGRQRILVHQLFLLATAVGASPAQLLYDHDTPLDELVPAKSLAKLRDSHSDEELSALQRTLNSAGVAQQDAAKAAAAS
jgi:transcriptional regulator with XRE-family HTH domain